MAPSDAFVAGISLQQLANVAGFVVFLGVSSLGATGAFGKAIGSVSNSLPTAVTPAGWAFSIWSVIYTLTCGMVVYQAWPQQRTWAWRTFGWWWAVNTLVGEALWTPAWCLGWGSQWVAALLLAFIVATNAGAYLRMDAGVAPFPKAGSTALLSRERPALPLAEVVLVQGGLGLYLGWTTAATILNITIALTASGVDPAGPAAVPCAVLVLLTAAALAVAAAITRTDCFVSGALAWALSGIYSQQQKTSWPVRPSPAVGNTALAAAVIAGLAAAGALAWRVWLWRSGRLRFAGWSRAYAAEDVEAAGGTAGMRTGTGEEVGARLLNSK